MVSKDPNSLNYDLDYFLSTFSAFLRIMQVMFLNTYLIVVGTSQPMDFFT